MPEEPSIIIKPQSGDTVLAEDVLKEICEVLRKRGYALIHQPGHMLLGKVEGDTGMTLRGMAYVYELAPQWVKYKPIDWSGDIGAGDLNRKLVS